MRLGKAIALVSGQKWSACLQWVTVTPAKAVVQGLPLA